jgi:hypothetical protein
VARLRTSRGHYESFTVRIWCPDQSGEPAHGQVVHVGSRRSTYFRDLPVMLAFIRRALRSPVAWEAAPGEAAPDREAN